ncbi:reverse transcriptase domain-containing protein, partial [Tanacetum coccineum]
MYPPPQSQPLISHPSILQSPHQTISVPQNAYYSPQVSTQPMTEFPQLDLGFSIIVFSPGDDIMAYLNKAMAFLTTVASSRFHSTSNQLRTSSNLRNQVTIQDDRVTVQQVQGRQGQSYAGTGYKGNATSLGGNNTGGQARVVKCYNCQGEGHIARQCSQPKRPRNAAWFKEKAMLAEAQESGQILDEEQLAFLADPGILDGQAIQTTIPNNAAFQTEDLDAYDSNYDDVPHSETYHNDMDNQSVHAMQDFEHTLLATVQDTNLYAQKDSMILSVIEQMLVQMLNLKNDYEEADQEKNNESLTAELERYKEREKLALKQQIDSLEQNLSNQVKEKESLLQTSTVFKNKSKEKESKYMDKEIDLEKKIKKLDNIVYKVGQSAQTVHMLTKPQVFYDNAHKQALGYQNPFYLKKAHRIKKTLYDGSVISSQHVAMSVFDDDETLILEEFQMSNPTTESFDASPVKVEVPSELPKVSMVNASLKKLKFHLAKFDSVVKLRTTPDALTEEYFENNDLKAQLQDKDTTICKLKELIKSMRENNKEKNVNRDISKLKTINEELKNSVATLLSENERLCKEINHVKQVFKDQFDSIKKTRVRTKEQSDSLNDKLNLKSVENEDLKAQVKDKHVKRVHELLVYVRDTCPNAIKLSDKKVVVTPMNKVKKVRFSEPLTSLNNIKQVESSKTSDSNALVLSSTGLKCSTSDCRSKPIGNKKNDRILETPSNIKKNKVEAQPRKVNKKNHDKYVVPTGKDNVIVSAGRTNVIPAGSTILVL